MKVLVTGATGFIGGNLARRLVAQGHQVKALVRPGSNTLTIGSIGDSTGVETVPGDILDADSVDRGLHGCQWLFHCAASYTFWSKNPGDIYRTNVEGTAIVLDAAARAGVERVVYTSTVGTIGLSAAGLGNECTELPAAQLVGNYKKSKYQAEQIALEKARQGLPLVVVNPTATVGPWDVKPTPTGRIVLDYIRGRMPAYVDTGLNLVDVADVAEGHILAAEKGKVGQRYVLGNRNLTLKAIFGLLEGITGRKAPRTRIPRWLALGAGYFDQLVEGQFLGREPRIPLEGLRAAKKPMYVSSEKAIYELGLPQTPVEQALAEAVAWFENHGYK